jgi:predicted amidohydrolase
MPLARVATHENGEQIHIAQWPMVKDLHQIACRQYAFEGQCYVIAAGCTITKQQMIDGILSSSDESNPAIQLIRSIPVKDDDFLLSGGSAVIKPNTEYLIDPVLESNTIIYADLDLSILSEGNLFIDTNGHYSRPDVFQLHVNTKNHQNVIHRKNFED